MSSNGAGPVVRPRRPPVVRPRRTRARERRTIDGATYYEWDTTWRIVRELQPQAVIFSDAGPDVRWVGNEKRVAFETSWYPLRRNGLFPGHPKYTEVAAGAPDGTDWVPPEVDVSIRPGWFHHPADDGKVKTVRELVEIHYASVGRSANLLLNVPPDRRGPVARDGRGAPARDALLPRRDLRPRPRAGGAGHAARTAMRQDDDFAFIRRHLDAELAEELQLFRYKGKHKGPYQVQEEDLDALHEALLAPKYGFGAPTIAADRVRVDGTLELVHDHVTDGRGLDAERSSRVLDYLVKVWRRPITLATVNAEGGAFEISAAPA